MMAKMLHSLTITIAIMLKKHIRMQLAHVKQMVLVELQLKIILVLEKVVPLILGVNKLTYPPTGLVSDWGVV